MNLFLTYMRVFYNTFRRTKIWYKYWKKSFPISSMVIAKNLLRLGFDTLYQINSETTTLHKLHWAGIFFGNCNITVLSPFFIYKRDILLGLSFFVSIYLFLYYISLNNRYTNLTKTLFVVLSWFPLILFSPGSLWFSKILIWLHFVTVTLKDILCDSLIIVLFHDYIV